MPNTIMPLFILTTGGTIEKIYDEFEGALQNKDTIVKNKILQKLRLPYTEIQVKDIMAKDSLFMDDNDRASILDSIKTYSRFGNPIVVLHGTDTMAYTASALSFMLENLGKPVILTGSSIPLCDSYNDARRNLIVALLYASLSDISEV